MALFSVPNIKIAGISACVPKTSVSNLEYENISLKERELLIKTTGIKERRVADNGVTTSDLCYKAAKKLIEELHWEKEEIEILIFVSQSRDYFLPATAIILQDKLGLPKTTIALDISLGCSGYVNGLSVIASLMTTSKIKKGLLMVGDISTFSLNPKDKSTYPLFGDAGTVTALEYDTKANDLQFNLQSDGSGHETIIIPDVTWQVPAAQRSAYKLTDKYRTQTDETAEGYNQPELDNTEELEIVTTETVVEPKAKINLMREHVLKPGENIFRLALKYRVSQFDILAANNISKPDDLKPGMVIQIPPAGERVDGREAYRYLAEEQTTTANCRFMP